VTPFAPPCHWSAQSSRAAARVVGFRAVTTSSNPRRRAPPPKLSGRVILPLTSSSPSRGCRTQPRPPKFTGAPPPLKNSDASPHLRPPPWIAHLGESHHPSGSLAPPSCRVGGHREDCTTFQPTPRRRPPRHHVGPERSDRALGTCPLRHGLGAVG
jgi:hypothetical protein